MAIIDEGSVAGGARKVDMAQPNASRLMGLLEAETGSTLLERSPRGSSPTAIGSLLAEEARDLLAAAQDHNDWVRAMDENAVVLDLRVGASLTNAESLVPAWLTELRRRAPRVRVDLQVINSETIIEQVQQGTLQLGFVETSHVPSTLHSSVVHTDELVVVVAPDHAWAARHSKVTLQEVADTALVVREQGSGTRRALDDLLADLSPVQPAQVLLSNVAVRIAVASGGAPAVLSELAVRTQLASGELLRVPLDGELRRSLTAVWKGPRRLSGPAAELMNVARGSGAQNDALDPEVDGGGHAGDDDGRAQHHGR